MQSVALLYRAYFGKELDVEDVIEVHKAIADVDYYEQRQMGLMQNAIAKAFG